MARLDWIDRRAAARSAALACAAAASLSMVRRMRPHTSISQLSEAPAENWPRLLPTVPVVPIGLPAASGLHHERTGAAADASLSGAAGIADRRIELRLGLADQRHGLAIGRLVLLERLVGDVDLRHQTAERGIAIDRPPRAAIDRVAGQGRPEHRIGGLLELGRRRRSGRRPPVVRPDHAAGQRQDHCNSTGQTKSTHARASNPPM